MVIRFIGGSAQLDRTIVEWNKLTLENFTNEMRKNDLVFDADLENTIISFSYRVPAGRVEGTLDNNTSMDLDPTSVVMITQQPRETKARAYSAEELQDVIADSKAALVSQEYKALRSACRELTQVSDDVKKIIGNYTHYTVALLVDVVEDAVKFLSPEVVEVSNEDLQSIITRIEAVEADVRRIVAVVAELATPELNLDLQVKVAKIEADVDFINQHFDLK